MIYTFEQAKAAVAALKEQPLTKLAYRALCSQDTSLPKYPEKSFKDKWLGWGDFLGVKKITKYETIEEAKKAIQNLHPLPTGFTSYRKVYKQNPRLPANPEDLYRLRGWKSWPHFLGKTVVQSDPDNLYYSTYSLAKLALRDVGSPETVDEYLAKTKIDTKLPQKPGIVYKYAGWNGWEKFLSYHFYRSIHKAKMGVQSLPLVPKTRDQYRLLYSFDPMLMREPDKFYYDSWKGWKNFLRTDNLTHF